MRSGIDLLTPKYLIFMKKLLLLTLSVCCALFFAAACDSTDTEEPQLSRVVTQFDSTTMPDVIPGEGGDYTLTFVTQTVTRTAETVFETWSYRMTLGDETGEPIAVEKPTTEITVTVPANRSKEPRAVIVEMSTDAATWTKIVEATQEAALKDYQVTEFGSTNIPESIPYVGGDYEVLFDLSIETRAAEPQFVPWQYRVTVGETPVNDAVVVNEPTEKIEIHIDANYSEKERAVTIETLDLSENAVWTKIVEARQQAALEQVGGFYWTKSNIALRDGRFVLAEKPSDPGLFFRHGSAYGVRSDEAAYSGTAYTPDPVQIKLTDIPTETDADPCRLVAEGLRMPTYAELNALFNFEDLENAAVMDGINGMGYVGSSLFLPFGGMLSVESGAVTGRSEYGGYWALGSDSYGNGVIYSLNSYYSLVDYDYVGTNLAMVRCVRDIRQPKYLSHTPSQVSGYGAFTLTVETDPGDFSTYEVLAEGDDGERLFDDATALQTKVELAVPANESKTERRFRLFVNRIDTGVEFVQPAMSNYVRYLSHTPSSADYQAFTLTVRCDSDRDAFTVTIKGSDGLELSQTGSKENLTLAFDIPENTGAERTLSIWIDGTDTDKRVKQEAKPVVQPLMVEWSEGYLTVKDGAYVFTAPQERGLYFKHRSRYGFALADPIGSSSKYPGVAYGPEETTIELDAIPSGEVDPCSLVAPAGTWRMPSSEEWQDLLDKTTADNAARTLAYGDRTFYFTPAGLWTTKVMSATSVYVWSTTPHATKENMYQYLMWMSSAPKVAVGTSQDNAMMVRCVRNR